MGEGKAHKRAKRKAAGRAGQVELPVRSGRVDAATPNRATEVERSGDPARLRHSARKLRESGRNQRVLQVPNHHLKRATQAMRDEGVSGTVKNMSGTRRVSVPKKK